jgi:hypothetical protein
VFDPWQTTNWVGALKEGRIRAVVVPRPDVPPGAGAGMVGEPGTIFSQLYLMATPATAEQVAARLSAKGAGGD